MMRKIERAYHDWTFRVWMLLAAVFAGVFTAAPVAFAGNGPLGNVPTNVLPPQQSVNLQNNKIAEAIMGLLIYVMPVLGAVVMVIASWQLISTLYHAYRGHNINTGISVMGLSGKSTGMSDILVRVLEIFAGMVLLILFLSGAWTAIVNELFKLVAIGIDYVLNVINNAIAGG